MSHPRPDPTLSQVRLASAWVFAHAHPAANNRRIRPPDNPPTGPDARSGKHLRLAAVFVALISALLIHNYMQEKATVKTVTAETQTIAVEVVDLTWGTVIGKHMVRTEPYLKSSLPGGYFSDLASLEGRILLFPVKAREPILESRLAPTSLRTGGVAAVVSPKKRAVGVKVDRVIGVAGFVHPGNRVDVLVTINSHEVKDPTTKLVLENILVLAAGPEVEQKGKGEKRNQVDVITLELSPEEAEKLALSATQGPGVRQAVGHNDWRGGIAG